MDGVPDMRHIDPGSSRKVSRITMGGIGQLEAKNAKVTDLNHKATFATQGPTFLGKTTLLESFSMYIEFLRAPN